MRQLTSWGFSAESWKGGRGEYWVVAQAGLMLGFLLLPASRPLFVTQMISQLPSWVVYGIWTTAAALLLGAAILLIKGLVDLGQSLTPLPHPRADGQLVQTGSYGWVRHPLYSGIILAALGIAIGRLSLSHLVGALTLLLFFDLKARREELWLSEKYPDYGDYRQRVKKLIPWLY